MNYQVLVKTANDYWSGTDDKIFIKLVGLIESDWIELIEPSGSDYFEKGNTDKMEVKHSNLGTFNVLVFFVICIIRFCERTLR